MVYLMVIILGWLIGLAMGAACVWLGYRMGQYRDAIREKSEFDRVVKLGYLIAGGVIDKKQAQRVDLTPAPASPWKPPGEDGGVKPKEPPPEGFIVGLDNDEFDVKVVGGI